MQASYPQSACMYSLIQIDVELMGALMCCYCSKVWNNKLKASNRQKLLCVNVCGVDV
jgi:hypothetical protein